MLSGFEAYLKSIVNQNVKKSYDTKYLAGCIFKHNIPNKSLSAWLKANLFAALQTIERLREYLEKKDDFNFYGIKKHKFFITQLICELKPIIRYFDKSHDYDFLLAWTNSYLSFKYHRYAYQLIQTAEIKINNDNSFNYISLSVSPFVLRQSIEYKIKRMLGINSILNKNWDNPKIRHVFFFDFIKENEKLFNFKNVDFTTLKKVYQWANFHIHTGIAPWPWLIENALEITRPFFESGKTSQGGLSIHAAVELKNYDKLKQKVKTSLENLLNEEVNIQWLDNPEAVVLKSKK